LADAIDRVGMDRRGRTLACDDLEHYRKVVAAPSETLRRMAEIDAAIVEWPPEQKRGWRSAMIFVDLESTKGERLGIPRLTLNLSVENRATVPFSIVNVTAVIRVTKEITSAPDLSKAYFIGTGFLESAGGELSPKSSGALWQIVIPLSPYQLQKIEEMRNGKELFLNVEFFCTAVWRSDTPQKLITDITRIAVRVDNYSSDYCPFRVPQSDWVKTLKDLGYVDYVLCEIPLRGVPARVGLKKALTHLEDAWEHFSNGNDEETLVSCYKAFEFLAKQAKKTDPNKEAFEKILAGIEDERKRKRLELLMDYVCRFFALARHEEGQETVSFNRKDSEYALILAQGSLAYVAKSMNGKPEASSPPLPQGV